MARAFRPGTRVWALAGACAALAAVWAGSVWLAAAHDRGDVTSNARPPLPAWGESLKPHQTEVIPKNSTTSKQDDDDDDDDDDDAGQDDMLEYFPRMLARCHSSTSSAEESTPGTVPYKIKQADCGLGYKFDQSPAMDKHWSVALYGSWDPQMMELSGALIGRGRCPWSKKCQIIYTKDAEVARRANVVVVQQQDYSVILSLPTRAERNQTQRQIRVYYWREAVFTFVPAPVQRRMFDFEMGVHHYSGILNPFYLFGPSTMMTSSLPSLGGFTFLPPSNRTGFIMSIISNCGRTTSLRQEYLDALSQVLGPARVHQYGKCGNKHIPPKPIGNAARVIARYKFMLGMENTIMEGYTSEKLFMTLMMPAVLVYYGALDAPNITKTPSYIRASDFSSPRQLASYLEYLDKNDDEYMKYHAWRSDPSQFDDYYLEMMRTRVPGPQELEPYVARRIARYPRAAAFCRLCDENFVRKASAARKPGHIVYEKWSLGRVRNRFFLGKPRAPVPQPRIVRIVNDSTSDNQIRGPSPGPSPTFTKA